jgi:hypothetical protein
MNETEAYKRYDKMPGNLSVFSKKNIKKTKIALHKKRNI